MIQHGSFVPVISHGIGRAGTQGELALSVACKTLDFFAEFFAIPYPLAKLDLIAVPEFAAGAMEVCCTCRCAILHLPPDG